MELAVRARRSKTSRSSASGEIVRIWMIVPLGSAPHANESGVGNAGPARCRHGHFDRRGSRCRSRSRPAESEEAKRTLAVSTITILELLVGCRNKSEQRDVG